MIKYTKTVNYYKKQQFLESQEIDKKTFYNIDDAINYAKKQDLKHYNNKKSYSLAEEISIISREGSDYKKFYKTVDVEGFVTTNIKDGA